MRGNAHTDGPRIFAFSSSRRMARLAQPPRSLALLPDDVCHEIFGLLNGTDLPVCARCAQRSSREISHSPRRRPLPSLTVSLGCATRGGGHLRHKRRSIFSAPRSHRSVLSPTVARPSRCVAEPLFPPHSLPSRAFASSSPCTTHSLSRTKRSSDLPRHSPRSLALLRSSLSHCAGIVSIRLSSKT